MLPTVTEGTAAYERPLLDGIRSLNHWRPEHSRSPLQSTPSIEAGTPVRPFSPNMSRSDELIPYTIGGPDCPAHSGVERAGSDTEECAPNAAPLKEAVDAVLRAREREPTRRPQTMCPRCAERMD